MEANTFKSKISGASFQLNGSYLSTFCYALLVTIINHRNVECLLLMEVSVSIFPDKSGSSG